MDDVPVYHININFAAAATTMVRKINPLIERTAFGLAVAENLPSEPIDLPTFSRIRPSQSRALSIVATEFRTWLLASGLRDGIEAVNAFLEDVRAICAIVELSRTEQLTSDGWNEHVVRGSANFHKIVGIRNKLEALKAKYQLIIDAALQDQICTLNQARNCLVHRGGLVSLQQDSNDPDGLRVSWRVVELVVSGPSGERTVTDSTRIIEAGESLGVRSANTVRVFKSRESVTFSAQDFSDICLTLITFGQHVAQQLEAHAKASGLKFQPVDVATK